MSDRPQGIDWISLRPVAIALVLFAFDPFDASGQGNPFLPPGIEDRGWPFIRGPDRDAHSPEIHLADRWPAEGPPVLWTRPLGQGYSAFVAAGRRVWTQRQTLTGQYVICLDADTGETLWEHRYGWPYEAAGVYPGPRATPTVADARVFFAAPDGLVGCLDAATGAELWSVNVLETYGGSGVGFGYACSPAVVDGMVLLPVGGSGAGLVALEAASGKEIWKSGSDPASYTPAFPVTSRGRPLVIGYMQNSLIVVDRTTGAPLGRVDLSSGYDEHSAWPLFQDPYLWISGPFRSGSQLLQLPAPQLPDASAPSGDSLSGTEGHAGISPDSPQSLATVWKSRMLSNDVMSSVLVDGFIYGFDVFDAQARTHRPSRGVFRCIEFQTGKEQWSIGTGRPRRENSEREVSDAPEIGQCGIIAADGKLFLFNELGELILARSSPERYEELARATVLSGELVWTPPVLHRGRIYLRNHSHAVCVYVGEPSLLAAGNQPLLSVRDVPQSEYRDLASVILAIEPEYAFDIPSSTWLTQWYVASLALLLVSIAGAQTAKQLVALHRRESVRLLVFRVMGFGLGLAGTTVLSRLTGEFYFTWPLCLFITFDAVAGRLSWTRRTRPSPQRRAEWLALAVLLVVSAGYFVLCRRLSLVFEWVFLVGYVGALPFCRVTAASRNRTGMLSAGAEVLATVVAFSAFYAAGVAVLRGRY